MLMRSPNAIRPWQHVLDVLYGYIIAGMRATEDKKYATGYNFAPVEIQEITVRELTDSLIKYLGQGEYQIEEGADKKHEAHYLKLNANKAKEELGWANLLDFENTSKFTADWYKALVEQKDIKATTEQQLNEYFKLIA